MRHITNDSTILKNNLFPIIAWYIISIFMFVFSIIDNIQWGFFTSSIMLLWGICNIFYTIIIASIAYQRYIVYEDRLVVMRLLAPSIVISFGDIEKIAKTKSLIKVITFQSYYLVVIITNDNKVFRFGPIRNDKILLDTYLQWKNMKIAGEPTSV